MTTDRGVRLDFLTSPSAFLDTAGEWLSREPVIGTVVATMAQRGLAAVRSGLALPADDWWLVVRDGPEVVGAGMRSAPFTPRPLFLLPMPDQAAVALARALVERGEEVLALNGALPATRVCADELARLTGQRVEVAVQSRLHQAPRVVRPREPEGRLRQATLAELGLARRWFAAFLAEADAQAGRPAGSHAGEVPRPEEMRSRLEDGQIWLWEVDGEPTHLTALNPPSFGVARIGPVYTPQEHRGHGYAGATVAALTERVLEAGDVPCLFTDLANPISNALYARIGYEPLVDMANFVLT
ncbi:GNAT family N-acetyltransferase [Nocardioides sp.]|uniref:GNAT family N-acetyltransferase n=1 Tax=Nocardioides sp. TaxID=35761 RepID=UPI002B61804C|nr:GNAT family N-acetyltransferase [Nocardioides sp.]HSX69282.1 GNAT family N-acetyltransferase [Nocardioides sp.]